MNVKKSIKGQGLPLNTLVIAILVIIVLLVLVVSFTSNFGKSNDQLTEVSGCSLSNPLVKAQYKNADSVPGVSKDNFDNDADAACGGSDREYISLIPKTSIKDDEGNVKSYTICCGEKK